MHAARSGGGAFGGREGDGGRGGGGGGRRGPVLDRDEFRVMNTFWPEYFPDEVGATVKAHEYLFLVPV